MIKLILYTFVPRLLIFTGSVVSKIVTLFIFERKPHQNPEAPCKMTSGFCFVVLAYKPGIRCWTINSTTSIRTIVGSAKCPNWHKEITFQRSFSFSFLLPVFFPLSLNYELNSIA